MELMECVRMMGSPGDCEAKMKWCEELMRRSSEGGGGEGEANQTEGKGQRLRVNGVEWFSSGVGGGRDERKVRGTVKCDIVKYTSRDCRDYL